MSNLPLKALKWARIDTEKLAGIYCQKTDSYIKDAVSFCSTPVAEYVIRQDKETGKYRTNYGGRTENPYDTIDEAEHWAEHTHYASQMQPYVKPSPTWIDVDERLPDKSGRYMVVHQTIKPVRSKSTPVDIDTYDENEKAWTFFRSGIMQEVTHWMPIPEFSEVTK